MEPRAAFMGTGGAKIIFYGATAQTIITGIGFDQVHEGAHPSIAIYYPDAVRSNMLAIAKEVTKQKIQPTVHLFENGEMVELVVLFRLESLRYWLARKLFESSSQLKQLEPLYRSLGRDCQLIATAETDFPREGYWYKMFLEKFRETCYLTVSLTATGEQSSDILWSIDLKSYEVRPPTLGLF